MFPFGNISLLLKKQDKNTGRRGAAPYRESTLRVLRSFEVLQTSKQRTQVAARTNQLLNFHKIYLHMKKIGV